MTQSRHPGPFGRSTFDELEARDVPAGDGLTGVYYDNLDFTGTTVTRVDPLLNFRWGTGSPAPGIGADSFSVRWTGQLDPAYTQTYSFYTLSDDGVRLWVNGRLLIDNWLPHGATEDRGAISLQAGQWADIRVDYYDRSGAANIGLSWASPSQPKQVIPTARMYSVPSAAAPTGLTATVLSAASIQLNWTDNATNETGYVVERAKPGGAYTVVGTLGANAQSYTNTGLSAMTSYSFRVRAVNAGGSSAPSGVVTATTPASVVTVGTTAAFRAAVNAATPGTRIAVLPGVYEGNNYFGNTRGEAGRPIIITAADPANKPIFRGGTEGLHFSEPAFLELSDLVVELAGDNGINIDDAGTYDTPARHVTLSGLLVQDIGGVGNKDGIKLSGVQNFQVVNCTVLRWGTGGSGIDMVGCHAGLIQGSYFSHGDTTGANGVQVKGGSTWIVIRGNRFQHAGARAVQIGGSTGLGFFRPQPPPGYEASNITVERNVIVGSEGAVAFVNVDGSVVRYNTIYRPTRYAFRILQENNAPGFVPCRNGVIDHNIIAFLTGEMLAAVNVGGGTAANTFTFTANWWYCVNNPSQSTPSLPAPETGGVYGIDPRFLDPANGNFQLQTGSPAVGYGAYP